jgi:hypothetical protein
MRPSLAADGSQLRNASGPRHPGAGDRNDRWKVYHRQKTSPGQFVPKPHRCGRCGRRGLISRTRDVAGAASLNGICVALPLHLTEPKLLTYTGEKAREIVMPPTFSGSAPVKCVAHSERFELPTLGIEIRCSIQLSYECINVFNRLRWPSGARAAINPVENTKAERTFGAHRLPDLD